MISGAFAALAGILADTAVMAAAYAGAFVLRLGFVEPNWGWRSAVSSFAVVWAVETAVLAAFGCTRRWRLKALDVPRYAAAFASIGAILLALRAFLPDMAVAAFRAPYSIAVLNTLLLAVGMCSVRFIWGVYWTARMREEGLLSRAESEADSADIVSLMQGKTVMVTGAGGSIGSEIVRQVAECGASIVVMVERCENALYEIDRRMRALGGSARCIPEMADINDIPRMEAMFAKYRPQIVLHAAAYKHVPMVELHPAEGLRNNTLATRRLGEMARESGVARFVMISTDKAVNPVSVMGITKRLAEILLMDLNGGATRFACVRFGNVLGSSGSVVPLFEEQIAHRGPVTVTHPEMKRYFMTVREAVSLVLKAAAQGKSAIFTLDMGKPVRIVELAEQMIRAAGLRPYDDVPIVFTGVRPGEKLFEELDVSEKSAFKTGHARIYVCRPDEPRASGREILDEAARIAASPGNALEDVRAMCRFI